MADASALREKAIARLQQQLRKQELRGQHDLGNGCGGSSSSSIGTTQSAVAGCCLAAGVLGAEAEFIGVSPNANAKPAPINLESSSQTAFCSVDGLEPTVRAISRSDSLRADDIASGNGTHNDKSNENVTGDDDNTQLSDDESFALWQQMQEATPPPSTGKRPVVKYPFYHLVHASVAFYHFVILCE